MKFFSGFSLKNEQNIFKEYIKDSDFTVAGFSYGAIKAFEYVCHSDKRVDTLQLFSPAFFQNSDEKFKKLQLIYYKKDKTKYIKNFLKNISYPSNFDVSNYCSRCEYEELKELLYYKWDKKMLQELLKAGIMIEVYLGGVDKIVNSNEAKEFFQEFATVYFIKNAGHILC
jgi:predicted alpha/beta hydrolase family esterase